MFVEKTAGFEERGDSVVDGTDLMIEAAGVQKVYEAGGLRVRALKGVDLGIPRGEMVAVMGPSGCGKTTLLNVLSGLDDLSDGEVRVDGESIGGMSDKRRTRFRAERMGFIFQSYNLIPVLSAVENVELPLLVAGKKPKKARRWALDALGMVGLPELPDGEVGGDGQAVGGMSEKKSTPFRAERRGFIFQSYNLTPVLSAVETVDLPLLVAGKKPKKARRWALDALGMVGLPEQATRRPSEMSGGQQQRVTVARSLVNDPSIVWADEPTGALDSETSGGIMDLLVRLNAERRQTFVLVTHDAAVAARAHRTILMRDGNITSDEPNDETKGQEGSDG